MEAQAPAWGQGGMAFPTQEPVMPVGMMPVPYQAMQGMVQNGFSETVPGFGQPAVRMGNPGQAALYDEIVVTPSNETPPWKKSPEKTKAKAASGSVGRSVVQAEWSLPPGGGGTGWSRGKTGKDRASQKVTRRMEEILRRKAELEQSFSPGLAPVAADSQDEGGTFESSSPAPQMPSPVVDKQAAYRRPVGSTGQGAIQQPTMSGRRLDEPDLQLPDTKATQQAAAQKKATSPYAFPPVELLNQSQRRQVDTRAQDTENAARLESTLESFGIEARVQRVTHGPAVTRFELGLVSSGINVKRIISIADNIALELAANGGVRIEVPIPGTNLFGIEIPNKEIVSVPFRGS